MQLIGLTLLILLALGCSATHTYNVVDMTDDQYIEDAHGNRCIDKEMIITVDSIVYLYPECGIRRVVKPRPHILPTPSPRACTDHLCSP